MSIAGFAGSVAAVVLVAVVFSVLLLQDNKNADATMHKKIFLILNNLKIKK
jgi:hypothetical protein